MSWEMVKLGDVCEINMGKTPSRSNPKYWGGNNPWVSIADLKRDYFISKTKENITDLGVKESGIKIVLKNTLLYSFKLSIGKIAITANDLYTNEAIVALPIKDTERLNLHYLYYATQKINLSNVGDKAVKGITLNKEKLKSLQIPLPPLSTQKRIAEILDKADALRKADRQLLKHYDNLAQSLFIDLFGDPVKNEKCWEVKKLGELGNWKSGGTPSRSKSEFFTGDIPWISSGELNDIFISKSIESITEQAIKNSSSSLIPIGSLLLGMYDTAALKSSINKVVLSCNQAIAFAHLDRKLSNVLFIYHLIQMGKEEFKKAQRGVRQKNLNLSMIKDIKTINPPIALQNRFAEQIHNIEQQKEKVKAQLLASEHLFQALLKQAFSGGLN